MSTTATLSPLSSPPPATITPAKDHSRALADAVRTRRERLGLSIARAATSAGLLVFEWFAIEAGKLIPDQSDLDAIAHVVQMSPTMASLLALISRENQPSLS